MHFSYLRGNCHVILLQLTVPAEHDDSNATLLLRTDHPAPPRRPHGVLRPLPRGQIRGEVVVEGGGVRGLRRLLSLLLLRLGSQLAHRRHQSM